MPDGDPRLDEQAVAAVRIALARSGLDLEQRPAGYAGAWRHAAAREAVEGMPARASYALSPRSTRGATRA